MDNTKEDIVKAIAAMSHKELSAELKALNERVGPINQSTRKLYEKKLLKRKCGEEQVCAAAEDNSNNSSNMEQMKSEEKSLFFYGIQVDPEDVSDTVKSCVLSNASQFHELLKRVPRARFKKFIQESDAESFAQSVFQSPKPPPVGEVPPPEVSEFRSVRVQELMRLGREIEVGNINEVRSMIWSNPRYLITSGDTPTVLKVSTRYNALHCACAKNQADICRLLLDTLNNLNFFKLLYPTDTDETQYNRMNYLQDMYLNMPDKGLNESPLHFACKFGQVDAVQVLALHPKSDKSFRNRDGKTPAEVICGRTSNPTRELCENIRYLLEDQYYVPLFRSEDNSFAPRVGQPWSPTVKNRALPDLLPSLPLLHSSPKEVNPVGACAGPMSPKQAEQFRKTWLTPPSPSPVDRRKWDEIRRGDFDKGMERVGRTLAEDMKVGWKEHWGFLHSFTDLSTPNGLQQLERHLADRSQNARQRMKWENDLNEVSDNLKQITLDDNQHQAVDLNVTPNYVQYMDLIAGTNSRGTRTDSFDVVRGFASLKLNRCDSSESSGSYVSAREEFDDEPLNDLSKESSSPVYLVSDEPSKTDLDVYRALANASVSRDEFPFVDRWLQNVRAYSDQARNHWRTPRRNAQVTPLKTPLRLAATSPLEESPSFNSDASVSEEDSDEEKSFKRVKVNLLTNFSKELNQV